MLLKNGIYLKEVTLNGTGIFTQNKMSFKRECHLKWDINEISHGMSLNIECYSKLIVTHNGISLKLEGHWKCNVIQNRMSLKMECH